MTALVLFLVSESVDFSCVNVPSISDFPINTRALIIVHDYRFRLLTLQEARALLQALPASDSLEEIARRAALCWLRGFAS